MNLRVFLFNKTGAFGWLPISPPKKRISLIHVHVNQADFLRDMRMINDVHSCGERCRAWRS